MVISEKQAATWILITIIITAAICFAIAYAYYYYMQQCFISQFTQSNRSCSDVGQIEYREPVYVPRTNGVYEKRLATALIDVSLNTTKANCTSILPLKNPPGFTHQLRIEGIEPFSGQKQMFAYIFWNPETQQAIFAFTGTAGSSVAKSNLRYEQVPPLTLNGYQSGVLCHEGFYGIYNSIRDQLWDWWNNNSIRVLFITGHSLGGALSTLCSYDFAGSTMMELIHYSFAAPRVGNTEFVDVFSDRVPTSIRVNNTEDAIPSLPPAKIYDYIYEQSDGSIPFTIALDSLSQNHIEAYVNNLPTCAEVAPCQEENQE